MLLENEKCQKLKKHSIEPGIVERKQNHEAQLYIITYRILSNSGHKFKLRQQMEKPFYSAKIYICYSRVNFYEGTAA